ncbi:DEAD/DEAH box helicase [Clostridium sp. 'White wine YQ']|uniref:DEAD/DEAH box helicase n=1 Tax=Clostridium sp. 'White wine YQ' TaxID=3027474 RepID=UPI0023661801|nr:SNF2 helicase associated domain-containing protein [Clostridium sp. 'White wine YQ']MDD7795200.1 SNF2 helicase associated domain-containing protein [Clostridium sp. 'White wine YQ']
MNIKSALYEVLDRCSDIDISKAKNVYNQGCILSGEYKQNEGLYIIKGDVLSQDLINTYYSSVIISEKNAELEQTYCSCADYEKNSVRRVNYRCKHINALLLYLLNQDQENIRTSEINSSKRVEDEEKMLMDFFKMQRQGLYKQKITLETYVEIEGWYFNIHFKIGNNKLYVVKGLREFLEAFRNKGTVEFGKEFVFQGNKHTFSKEDKNLIKYLITQMAMEDFLRGSFSLYNKSIIKGKAMTLPIDKLRETLSIMGNHKIFLKIGFEDIGEVKIVKENLPISYSIREEGNHIFLTQEEGYISLNKTKDVFLNGSKVYLPSEEQVEVYGSIYEKLGKEKVINSKFKNQVLGNLLPIIERVTSDISLDRNMRESFINEPLKVDFYLDREKDITLEVLFRYGEEMINPLDEPEDFGDKFITRELDKEKEILEVIEKLNFAIGARKFVLKGGEAAEFYFLRDGVQKLITLGNIYYSDRVKKEKVVKEIKINALMREERDYFTFQYDIDELSPEDAREIIYSINRNKKYHKIKGGAFIDLDNEELKKLHRFIESVTSGEEIENEINIPKNKALVIESLANEERATFINGLECIDEMKKRIHSLENFKVDVPKELRGELREYQKMGYSWMKSLDYLGFGGILGDEMGLGKTLQAITFILSNKGKKTLIVAPTSLVYNWLEEFNKFAPSLKVEVMAGTQTQRNKTINNLDKLDVLITSYGVLKRDEELYKKVSLDYLIIDEAQNIKNSSSQNAETVKSLNAKRRFALTGTPLENSLVELWSIFDFLMPGYLYGEKKFKRIFEKQEEGINNLSLFIKPFILRRLKRDVIQELPDKIEKNILIDMERKQEKIYKAYADYAKERIREELSKSGVNIKVLAYLTKLRQLSLDPALVVDNYNEQSGKLGAFLEILNQSIEEGHKVLVFSQFTTMLKRISELMKLNEIEHFYLDGATKAQDRIKMVNSFNVDETKVFLISLKAGGTGLNLTGADVVIHFDPWWNPAVEDQATDRAHRFGQKNVVEVIKLIAKGSVEEKIIKLQESKKELINMVLENGLDSGEILKGLKEEELLKLFG